jgi:hypothetical protein
MKFTNMLLMLGAVIALSSGCATKQLVPLPDQTKVIEDPSKARIYVLRPIFLPPLIPMTVSDGDQKIGSTGPHGYLCWERAPGETEIRSKSENTAVLPLTCKAGEVYYIGQHARVGFSYARTALSLLSEEQGKEKMTKCKPPHIK